MQLIAKKVVEGVLNKEIQVPRDQLYAVCVGAYTHSTAKAKVEELKAKGYIDTYLIPR